MSAQCLLAITTVGLLALPAAPDQKRPPVEEPAHYVKVEVKGRLDVKPKHEGAFLLTAAQPVRILITADGICWDLSFNGNALVPNKELLDLARKLDGQSVVVEGVLVHDFALGLDGARFPPRLTVKVARLRAATAKEKPK